MEAKVSDCCKVMSQNHVHMGLCCVVDLLHQDPQMPGLPSLCFFWMGGPIGSARADNSCMVTSYRQGFKCVRQMNPPASSLGLTFAAPSFPSRLGYLCSRLWDPCEPVAGLEHSSPGLLTDFMRDLGALWHSEGVEHEFL